MLIIIKVVDINIFVPLLDLDEYNCPKIEIFVKKYTSS